MNKHSILLAGLCTLLLIGMGKISVWAQSKAGQCTNSVLALNMAPVKKLAVKKPCSSKKEKRVNESPQRAISGTAGYYNNVMIDELNETFINAYPGLATTPAAKPCPPGTIKDPRKITACNASKKQKCDSQKEKETPKRLRPSATVKLAKYIIEQ